MDPVLEPLHSEYLVAQEIEPGPLDLKPRTLITRPQRRSVNEWNLSLFFYKLFISNQNYIIFYKLICCDFVWREEAYSKVSTSVRSAGTASPETNSVPFLSPLTTRRDYGGSSEKLADNFKVMRILGLCSAAATWKPTNGWKWWIQEKPVIHTCSLFFQKVAVPRFILLVLYHRAWLPADQTQSL
jgi:hypothetical protein